MRVPNFFNPSFAGIDPETGVETRKLRYTHEFHCTNEIYVDACLASWIDWGPRSADHKMQPHNYPNGINLRDPYIGAFHKLYKSWFRGLYHEVFGHYLGKRCHMSYNCGRMGTVTSLIFQGVNGHFVDQQRRTWTNERWLMLKVSWDGGGWGRIPLNNLVFKEE